MTGLIKMGGAVCVLVAVALVGGGFVFAADKKGGANVGDKAPSFQATDDEMNVWKASDHVGKKVIVLYFYPADFTGGCTKQACGFRDNLKDLSDKNVEVVGVSGDSATTHGMFKKAENLGFTLLADEKGTLAKQFGIQPGKGGKINHDGQTLVRGVTIPRVTVIIGLDGTIAAKYPVTDAAGDSKKALEIIQKLTAK
jgi:thioredoxin-dependent peroxiredoxin